MMLLWLTLWPLWCALLLAPAIMMSPGCGCCGTEPPLGCGLCVTCARSQIEITLDPPTNGTSCTNCADWFNESIIVDSDYINTDVCEWGTLAYVSATGCGINSGYIAWLELIDDNPGVTVRLTLTFYQIFTSPSFTYWQVVVFEYSFPSDPIDCCDDLYALDVPFVSQTGSTDPANYKDDYAMGDTYFCDFSLTSAQLFPITP